MSTIESLLHIEEPGLRFGYDQVEEDPRDGLFFFGPLMDVRKPASMRVGVIGTPEGLSLYRSWLRAICQHIPAQSISSRHHFAFPGFEAVFKTPWPESPVAEIAISAHEVSRCLRLSDRHQAIYDTVSLFEQPLRKRLRDDDANVDVWFVIVPDEVHLLGRPLSRVPRAEQVQSDMRMSSRQAKRLLREPSLFTEANEAAKVYAYDLNFHHQLKHRVLDLRAVLQVVRESTLASLDVSDRKQPAKRRRLQDPATLAWNLSTSSYFKAGGRPWRLANVREGVCYVGIVFKKANPELGTTHACCGAQMFLDTGDGMVFKGAMGPWWSPDAREFHLDRSSAENLLRVVVDTYRDAHGKAPSELFLHGKTRFSDEEWEGFSAAVTSETNLVGVRISRSQELKLFRSGQTPILRGTAYAVHKHKGFLWTAGYVPRLETYAGRDVPNPIAVDILKGDAELSTVLRDVLALTKVNFNACIFGDGLPVTLRFADAVGEILTAGGTSELPPLPFRHYI